MIVMIFSFCHLTNVRRGHAYINLTVRAVLEHISLQTELLMYGILCLPLLILPH